MKITEKSLPLVPHSVKRLHKTKNAHKWVVAPTLRIMCDLQLGHILSTCFVHKLFLYLFTGYWATSKI